MRGNFQGRPFNDKGRVLVFEPTSRLSFSHWSELAGDADVPQNYHVVSFELLPRGKTTVVTLTQSNLVGGPKPSNIKHKSEYEKNWNGVLDGLATVVAQSRGIAVS